MVLVKVASVSLSFVSPSLSFLFRIISSQIAPAALHNAGVAICCCCCSSRPTSSSNRVVTSSPRTLVMSTSQQSPSKRGINTDRTVISNGANGLSNHRKANRTLSLLKASTSSRVKYLGQWKVANHVASRRLSSA